jgi:hypothetical protein
MDMIEVHYVHTARHKLTLECERGQCARPLLTLPSRAARALGSGTTKNESLQARQIVTVEEPTPIANAHGTTVPCTRVHAFSHRGAVIYYGDAADYSKGGFVSPQVHSELNKKLLI